MGTFRLKLKTQKRNVGKLLFSFLLILVFQVFSFGQTSTIQINPASTVTDLGDPFTVFVHVDISAGGSVSAVQIGLNFDRSVLQVTNITRPSAALFNFEIVPLPADYTVMNGTGAGAGEITYQAGITAGSTSTDFDFLAITFVSTAAGTTPLTFNTTAPRQTRATFGATVVAGPPVNAPVNGSVSINAIGCTTPLATISAPGGTTTCNAQSFNLTLASASDGTGPFDLTIDGPGGTATYNNIEVGNVITTFVPPTVKIWPDPSPSPFPASNDDASYTLGMKFTSAVSGFVKGIRFFSSGEVSPTPGEYTGQLWTETGTLLTSGTFTGVTFDSWQELLFTEPVLIAPGTVYVASYNTGTFAGYASTTNGLATDITNGPLTAIGGGGLYNTGSTITFPGIPPFGGATSNNYWVDVLFSPNQYSFNLTGVKDALECFNTGALQSLSVTSVDCATLPPLPVSLLNISATPKDNSILLAWSTASEINNKGFEIQRKTGTGDWSVIGFVNGAGTSNSTRNYNHIDEKLSAARYYYRLRQVDIDGRFEYSPVVSAIIGGAEKFSLEQNYPNPFRSETVVRFTLPQKANVKLTLFDMHGRVVKTLINGSKEKGTHAVTVNASVLSSGLYYYRLESDNFSEVKKMTIQ